MLSMVTEHINQGMELPNNDDLSGAMFSLLILQLTYRIHPIELVDGKLGHRETNASLTFDEITHIIKECLSSTKPFSILKPPTLFGFPSAHRETKHYAIAIEWMEAAEM